MAIDWLREASLTAVARQLGLSWDEVDGIQARAVARGLARRVLTPPQQIGVDETSFQKRHEYVTVVCDLKRDVVVYVADEHKETSLAGFYDAVGPAGCAGLELVCLDMWRPYFAATRQYVPGAERKIAFDRFHVAQLLGEAMDLVRRSTGRCGRAGIRRSPGRGTGGWPTRSRWCGRRLPHDPGSTGRPHPFSSRTDYPGQKRLAIRDREVCA